MKMKLGTLSLVLAWLTLGLSGCGRDSSTAKSEEELKSILAEAFREGDINTVSHLFHESTDPELKKDMVAFIKPWFDFKPEKVSPSIVQLEDISLDLPGELNGRPLEYTTRIDGVIFLDGRSPGEHGEDKVTLYMPYTRSADGYSLAGVAYGKLDKKKDMAKPREPSE
jgi:hypothetical protein